MPLPVILGIGAGIAAAAGLGSGVSGGLKMKKASGTLKEATAKRDEAISRFESANEKTTKAMDQLGELELKICSEFQEFADEFEKIQNRPEFKEYVKGEASLPEYDPDELKKVSVGASVLLGGMGGAVFGTAGGFAAAGVTTSAVMALGTASTGTAIASLSGAAATNATLAALGGGAIAAGGGGIALGTTMLGVSTLGVGLMVGGIIFNITGGTLSKKADKAYYQALEIEREVDKMLPFLNILEKHAKMYKKILKKVSTVYDEQFEKMKNTLSKKQDWRKFTEEEKLNVKNCVLIVGLLYKMCKVNLVLKPQSETDINTVNVNEINGIYDDVNSMLGIECA